MRACNNSALSKARLTLDGHSVVQALQDKQLLKAASSSALRKGLTWSRPRCSKAARMALARPRVLMSSSWVTRKVGHMVGDSFRQPPHPLHCSRLATKDPSLAAKASTGAKGGARRPA